MPSFLIVVPCETTPPETLSPVGFPFEWWTVFPPVLSSNLLVHLTFCKYGNMSAAIDLKRPQRYPTNAFQLMSGK